jgi:hypothetical protein
MVLLPKQGRSSDLPSAFRPVCLLDQVGKLLERIVVARLESHLSRRAPGRQPVWLPEGTVYG